MIRDSARSYAQEKLMPRVKEAYNKEHFDVNILKEMGSLGFLGCTINEYDLPGVSSVAYGNFCLQLKLK
jgi:glutaryl-CoA dehydrogenase